MGEDIKPEAHLIKNVAPKTEIEGASSEKKRL